MIPLLLALANAIPAVDRLISELVAAYIAARIQQNTDNEAAKNARNADAVDAAVAAARAGVPICAECPFARAGAGSHSAAPSAPAIPCGSAVGA